MYLTKEEKQRELLCNHFIVYCREKQIENSKKAIENFIKFSKDKKFIMNDAGTQEARKF